MDEERKLLISSCITNKEEVERILCQTLVRPNIKDAKASEELRKKGNDLYLQSIHSQKLHEKLLCLYNKSAAFAPSGSAELAYAYGNRSAFLLHIGKYKECIQDIRKALKLTMSDALKVKLLCRQLECLKKLGCPTYKDVLQEAKKLIQKVDDHENKQSLENMVKNFSSLSLDKNLEGFEKTNTTVDLPVTDDVMQRVSIRRNEKYGRHLVAKQNYNPGDIIFVEKLFLWLNSNFIYINCHHCLKICWNGVPCNSCNWAVYCSEDCSQIAWKEYHDVECSLGTFSSNMFYDQPWNRICGASVIKILLRAIKDAGGIDHLRAQLEAVDQDTDDCHRGFYKDGKFNSHTFDSFCSLKKKKYTLPSDIALVPLCVLTVLIGLMKHPLMNLDQVRTLNDMIKNKDIMFLGTLLLRMTAIFENNAFQFVDFLRTEEDVANIPEDPRGSCVSGLVSLLNHSCFPNASTCFTQDGKVIVYALQSIKKDSQIFISYTGKYYNVPLEYRKEYMRKYNFECDCQPCIEYWPPVLLEYCERQRFLGNRARYSNADAKFAKQYCSDTLDVVKQDDYYEKSLKILASKVTLALDTLRQPSTFTCILQEALSKCITKIYNGLQLQFYGDCKKCTILK